MHNYEFTANDARALQVKSTATRAAKRLEWQHLGLRQHWADEDFMRAHLRAAGILVGDSNEPATMQRLALLLRRAGVAGPEVVQSVGPKWKTEDGRPMGRDAVLSRWLALNPDLPLWAATALVLELTGRFTPAAGMHLN